MESVTETDETSKPKTRPAAWKFVGLGVLTVIIAAQSAVLVVQDQRITDLEHRAAIPGPKGPAGPQGPPGQMGPQGLPGIPGTSGPTIVTGTTTGSSQQMTELEARATCQTQASQAWPDPHDSDPSLQQMAQAYTDTMRQKAFDTCMTQAGFPQQN